MSAPLQRFVNAFTVGLTMRMIYFPRHPSVLGAAERVVAALGELAEEIGSDRVAVGHARGRLVFEGRAVLALTPLARRMIEFFDRLGAGAFRFTRELSIEELLTLFSIYADTHARVAREEAQALLAAQGITHVELMPPLQKGEGGAGGGGAGGGAGSSTVGGGGAEGAEGGADGAALDLGEDDIPEVDLKAYHSLMAVVDTNHVQAARSATIDVAGARTRAEQMVREDLQRLHDLMRLAHYPDFDAYTVGHSVRVALLVTLVTERLGVARERMVEIAAAALLHDVGKSQIPHEILFKPGPLDAEERRLMEAHPRLGGELLIASGEANPWSVCAAYGHHVRHDRRGYPKLPPWVKQTPATELIHVCDVFEALTAVRPYKPAFTPWRAYEIMLRDHGGFDPSALHAFVRAIGIFPPGSNVVLSDGAEGVVVRAGARPDRPILQIRRRADGVSLDLSAAETCDLSDPAHATVRVTRLLPPTTDDPEPAATPTLKPAANPAAVPVVLDPCDPTVP